ncbi:MAG: hypothetical protein JNK64_40435 [Myxococcales bacterium]|nr:hypothetical protein [Myxococcales bacterium]
MRASFLAVIAALALLACGHPAAKPAGPPPPSGPVTEAAIVGYLQQSFPAAVAEGTLKLDWGSPDVPAEVVDELAIMGIDDMGEVAALVPADFATKGLDAIKAEGGTNAAGLMRDLMIIHDVRGYFEKAWRNHWSANGPEDFPLPVAYGVDFQVIADLGVFDGGGEGYDEGDDGSDSADGDDDDGDDDGGDDDDGGW